MRSTDCSVVGSQVGICSYALGLHPLCYFFCFLCSFFSWLHMLKRGCHTRCYAHFLWLCLHLCSFFMVDHAKKRQLLCSRLVVLISSISLLALLYFCGFFFRWLGFRSLHSLFRSRALRRSFRTSLFCLHFFVLQRCSTPQTIPWKTSRRQIFFAPCTLRHSAYTLPETDK